MTCDVDLTTNTISNVSHTYEELVQIYSSGKLIKGLATAIIEVHDDGSLTRFNIISECSSIVDVSGTPVIFNFASTFLADMGYGDTVYFAQFDINIMAVGDLKIAILKQLEGN